MNTTALDYRALAKKAAGNWKGFGSFAWWGKPPDPENWMVSYTRNRDSGLLEVSNHHAIAKDLDRFDEGDNPSVVWQDHSHWACGWITAAVVRVYWPNGRVTKAFKVWCDLQERLADYQVLDEMDYSNRQYDATIENIEQEGRRLVRDGAPTDWPYQVHEWLSEHNGRELEDRDDQGGYPSAPAIREALEALSLFAGEDES